MDRSDEEAGRRRALGRIARTLGVSRDAFIQVCPGDRTPSTVEEETELLHLFRQIRDVQTRRRCIDLIRVLAEPSGER